MKIVDSKGRREGLSVSHPSVRRKIKWSLRLRL